MLVLTGFMTCCPGCTYCTTYGHATLALHGITRVTKEVLYIFTNRSLADIRNSIDVSQSEVSCEDKAMTSSDLLSHGLFTVVLDRFVWMPNSTVN